MPALSRHRGSIEVIALGAIVAVVGGFVAGWAVNGWRLGSALEHERGVVETQKQSIATLAGANKSCAIKVDEANKAMSDLVNTIAERHQKAEAAIAKAEKQAEAHRLAARQALSRAPAAPGAACGAMQTEALDYAKRRRAP